MARLSQRRRASPFFEANHAAHHCPSLRHKISVKTRLTPAFARSQRIQQTRLPAQHIALALHATFGVMLMRTEELVRAYVEHRLNAGVVLAPKTVRSYFDSARYAGPWYPPTPEQVKSSLQALRLLSPHSEQSHLRRLRTIAKYASEAHGIPDPWKGIKARRAALTPHRVFGGDDYARLRSACRDTIDTALLDLLCGSGIRIGEAPLTTDQVSEVYTILQGDEEAKIAFIAVNGKTGPRYAPLRPEERDLLLSTARDGRLWLSAAHPYNPPRHLTIYGLQTRWRKLVKRAGLTGRKLGTHTARHTFASTWVMNGGSIEGLQPILGHQSIETTQVYVNRLPGWVAAQLLKHDPLAAMKRAAQKTSGPEQFVAAPAPATQEYESYATGS